MTLKTSRFSRLNKIVGLGASVLGKSIQGALTAKTELETRIAQAKTIAKTLSELKGASMKLGQMLSIQGEAFLPPEVAEILSLLQSAAPAFSGLEMEELLKSELGPAFSEVKFFDKTALAAASIGQVHRGTLQDGTEVVFKIQYPGIAKAIDSEISLLKILLLPLFRMYAKNAEVDSIADEVKRQLKQEVDYLQEAQFLEYFGQKLKEDKAFIIPRSFAALTTKNVLTMSFEEGVAFKDFANSLASQEERNFLGLSVYRLLMQEIFELQTVQTDPNFGNYLIRRSGTNLQTVLLDFGSSRKYSEHFINGYRKFLRAAALDDKEEILALSYKMGLLHPDESDEAKLLFYSLCQTAIRPFVSPEPFDFTDLEFPQKINEMSFKLMRALKVLPAPSELLFLNRKMGGVYNYCRALKVKASFRSLLQQALNL